MQHAQQVPCPCPVHRDSFGGTRDSTEISAALLSQEPQQTALQQPPQPPSAQKTAAQPEQLWQRPGHAFPRWRDAAQSLQHAVPVTRQQQQLQQHQQWPCSQHHQHHQQRLPQQPGGNLQWGQGCQHHHQQQLQQQPLQQHGTAHQHAHLSWQPQQQQEQQLQQPSNVLEHAADKAELGDDQQRAVAAVLQGECVFLTGGAGVGKSFTIDTIVDQLRKAGKTVAVTASTGTAAVNLGGMTLHSWAGILDSNRPLPELAESLWCWPRFRDVWQKTDVLLVDEISMVAQELIEKIDYLARYLRGWRHQDHQIPALTQYKVVHELHAEPFGGLQVVSVGDFFQLPPVDRPEKAVMTRPDATGGEKKGRKRSRREPKYPPPDVIMMSVLPPGVEVHYITPAAAAAAAPAATATTSGAGADSMGQQLLQQPPGHSSLQVEEEPLAQQRQAAADLTQRHAEQGCHQQQTCGLATHIKQEASQQQQQTGSRVEEEQPMQQQQHEQQAWGAVPSVKQVREDSRSVHMLPSSQQQPGQLTLGQQLLLQARSDRQQAAAAASAAAAAQAARAAAPAVPEQVVDHEQHPPQAGDAADDDDNEWAVADLLLKQAELLRRTTLAAPAAEHEKDANDKSDDDEWAAADLLLTNVESARPLHYRPAAADMAMTGDRLAASAVIVDTAPVAFAQFSTPANSAAAAHSVRSVIPRSAEDTMAGLAGGSLSQLTPEPYRSPQSWVPTSSGGGDSMGKSETGTGGPAARFNRFSRRAVRAGSSQQGDRSWADDRQCPWGNVMNTYPVILSGQYAWREIQGAQVYNAPSPAAVAASSGSACAGPQTAHVQSPAAAEAAAVKAEPPAAAVKVEPLIAEVKAEPEAAAVKVEPLAAEVKAEPAAAAAVIAEAATSTADAADDSKAAMLDSSSTTTASSSLGSIQWARKPYPKGYCFKSPAWAAAEFKAIVLKQPFRQSEPELLAMLNEVRQGGFSSTTQALLRQLQRPLSMHDGILPTQLFATNDEVDQLNAKMYDSLPGPELLTCAVDEGWTSTGDGLPQYRATDTLDEAVNAQSTLKLKPGAQVVLLWNLDVEGGLANGTRGKVEGYASIREYLAQEGVVLRDAAAASAGPTAHQQQRLPRYSEPQQQAPCPTPACYCGQPHCPCVMADWAQLARTECEAVRVMLPGAPDGVKMDLSGLPPYKRSQLQDAICWLNHTGTMQLPVVRFSATPKQLKQNPTALGRKLIVGPQTYTHRARAGWDASVTLHFARTTLPLRLAWALTIHKSQGMSLTKLMVHLGRAFAAGMVYVALSRCVSLDSLQVVGWKAPVADVDVKKFYASLQQQ